MRSQALGLAEAVGLPVEEKRVALPPPWRWLPGGVLPLPPAALAAGGDALGPPWPRLVIGCGRRSIDVSLMVKRLSGGRTIAVHVQNAKRAARKFDLVVAMLHDRLSGDNVISVPTALHGITPQKMAQAREEWRGRLGPEGGLRIGVLVGGDTGRYRLSPAVVDRLIEILRRAHREQGAWAVITPSRRTAPAVREAIAATLAAERFGTLWDGSGDNPYLGILATSDRLIVTGESVSMISEALVAGRPVHVLPLEGHGSRHEAFLARGIGEGLLSPIVGAEIDWRFAGKPPLYPAEEPARRIRAMLGLGANV